jgi:hypothetical protein
MPELSCSVREGTTVAIAPLGLLWAQKLQAADK